MALEKNVALQLVYEAGKASRENLKLLAVSSLSPSFLQANIKNRYLRDEEKTIRFCEATGKTATSRVNLFRVFGETAKHLKSKFLNH